LTEPSKNDIINISILMETEKYWTHGLVGAARPQNPWKKENKTRTTGILPFFSIFFL